jgi:hypothetical protein
MVRASKCGQLAKGILAILRKGYDKVKANASTPTVQLMRRLGSRTRGMGKE